MKRTRNSKHEELLTKAWDAFNNNKYDDAAVLSRQVISENPESIRSIVLLALIDLEQKRFEDAVKGLQTCILLDKEGKNHGYFLYWIGRVYESYSFEPKNNIYDIKKANGFYEKALTKSNYPADLFMRLINKKKNPKDRLSLIDRGIKEFPDFITLYISLYNHSNHLINSQLLGQLKQGYEKTKSYTLAFLLGMYYEENEDLSEASSYYNFSLESAKEGDKVYPNYRLAIISFKGGDTIKAIEYLNLINNERSNFFFLQSRLFTSYILFLKDDEKSALECLESIVINEDFFQFDLNDVLIWLEGEYPIEFNHCIDFRVLENKIKIIRKRVKNDNKDLVDLVYLLLLKNNGKYSERFQVLNQIVNDISPDYLLEEYIDSYSGYFSYLIEKGKDFQKIIGPLINDLSNTNAVKQKILNSHFIKEVIEALFEKKSFAQVIHFGKMLEDSDISKINVWFELGYSYNEIGDIENAEKAYYKEIKNNPKSSASHNNLSLIMDKKGNIEEAFRLISEAKKLDPDKDLYERNFNRIKQIYNEQHQKIEEFKKALNSLDNETDYAISKLNSFIGNIKAEKGFKNNKIPIPNWMFSKLIGTNKEIANSLKEQWLSKRYIIRTEERNENNTYFYELNPYLEKSLEKINVCKIDEKWIIGFSQITKDKLEEIDYFNNILRINKINKKYKEFILRDYKELTINYLIKNEKATVIIAGSLTEYLLTYYCEKKKITSVSYLNQKRNQITKKLYDCELYDLINYFEEKNILKSDYNHLNNLSRIYRNYVHPGKELRDTDLLNINKAKICFIGVSELLRIIL